MADRREEPKVPEAEANAQGALTPEALDSFFDLSIDMLCIAGFDGYFKRINKAFETTLGYSHEELLSQPFLAFVHPDDSDATIRESEKLAVGGTTISFENRYLCKDGSYKWLRWNSTSDLQRSLIYAAAHDITLQKQAEAALRWSEKRYRSLIEASAAVVWHTPASGQFESEQADWSAFTGQTWQQLQGLGWLDAIHPDDRELTSRAWAAARENRSVYQVEHRLRRHDGVYRDTLVRAVPLIGEDGAIREWVGLHTDITESKQAGEDLRRHRDLLHAVIEGTTDAVFVKDLQGRYLLINPAGAAFLGKSVDQVVGQDDTAVFSLETARPIMEVDRLVMASGETLTNEDVGTAAGVTRTYLSTKAPYRDHQGRIIGLIGISRDITERRQAADELARQARELARSNQELEQFASVASHDLQEPLRKIQAFGGRLQTVCGDNLPPAGRDYVERMQSAAGRMQTLINDLLAFSRVTSHGKTFARVSLDAVLREVLSDLEVRIESVGARIEAAPLPVVEADPVQMRQLLQNLIANALKFRRPAYPPVVRIHSHLSSAAQSPPDDDGQPDWPGTGGPWCRLYVQDNGIGFDEKYLDRIFSIFQRLHSRAEYEGTGVGLAVCRKIVERHGGQLTARSSAGKGATFIVTLPILQPRSGHDASSGPAGGTHDR